jgi:pimeloyl-ACP methyl ester carboxylesterase
VQYKVIEISLLVLTCRNPSQICRSSMAQPTFEGMPQPLKDAYLKINPDTNALYTMYKRDVARMQSFKDIKAIKAPTLIIIGDNDVVRPEHAVEMYRQMQHAQLMILPGGHGEYMGEITTVKPGHHEYPVLPIIETFLNEATKQ